MATQQKNSLSLLKIAAWLTRHRYWAAIGATLLAIDWCGQAAKYLQPRSLELEDHRTAVRYLVMASLALGVAVVLSLKKLAPAVTTRPPLTPARPHGLALVGGIAALAIVTEYNAQLLKVGWPPPLTAHTQFILLSLGLLLVGWGLGGGGWRIDWREAAMVGAITCLAFMARAWRLQNAFPRFIDELNFATYISFFKDDNKIGLLWPEVRGFPTLYSYLEMHTVDYLGRNLRGVRAVSVILGTLTIPALYLLAKALFDRPTALIAALLLAVYPPHIQFSRLGLNNIADPLFGTLALAFYARAIHTQRRPDYALAGVCLGLTQYFYEGGRLLYPSLMLVWVVGGLWWWRPRWQGLVTMVVGLVIVAAPVYLTLYGRDQPFSPRSESQIQRGDFWDALLDDHDAQPYLRHLKFSFLAVVTQPEWMDYYYGGDNGLVLNPLLPLLFLGLGIVAWQFYRPPILLVIWVLSGIIGTSVMKYNVLTPRYVVIFPALVLLMAVGLRYTPRLLRLPNELQVGVIGVLVLVAMGWQVQHYFGEHLETFNVQARQRYVYDGEDALFRSRSFPEGTTVYIISTSAIDLGHGQRLIGFLADNITLKLVTPAEFTPEYIGTIPAEGDKAFFIEHFDKLTLDLLLTNFQLQGPFYSPYTSTPIKQQLTLFYAGEQDQQG